MSKNIFQRLTLPACCAAFTLTAIAVGVSGRINTNTGIAHAAECSVQGTTAPSRPEVMSTLDEIMDMQTYLMNTDVTVIPDSAISSMHYEPIYLAQSIVPKGDMPVFPVGDEEGILDMEGIELDIDTQQADMQAVESDMQVSNADMQVSSSSDVVNSLSWGTIHFNPSDITESSGMSRADIEDFVERRCSAWLSEPGIIDHLVEIDSKMNVVFLLSVARTETGGGEVCVGWHNCFNVRNADGSYTDYWSYTESIDDFVNLILSQYIDEAGDWHEGTSIDSINIHYAEAPTWGEYVSDIGYEIIDRYNSD